MRRVLKRVGGAAAIVLLAGLSGARMRAAGRQGAGGGRTERLAFMAGSWRFADRDTTLEEHWTRPAGGCLLGMAREIRQGKTEIREFEVIEERPEGVMMTIDHFTPDMKPIPGRHLERKMTGLSDSRAEFTVTGDPAQKLIYQRKGDVLDARIEFQRRGQPAIMDLPMAAVK